MKICVTDVLKIEKFNIFKKQLLNLESLKSAPKSLAKSGF